jgi:hypothetical protein
MIAFYRSASVAPG